MQNSHYDLIIIGFGPTGATLANIMGQYGWKVAVIEKEGAVYPHPRATHGDDETLRIFQAIGLLDEIWHTLDFFTTMQLASKIGKPLLNINLGEDKGSYGFGTDFWFHQPTLEGILRQGCQRFPNVSIFLDWRVTRIEQMQNSVLAKMEGASAKRVITSKYLIGCDGANSFVRNGLNIGFQDFNFNQKWLIIDTHWKDQHPLMWPPIHQQICNPKQPMSFIPGVGKHYRWEFMLLDEDSNKTAEVLAEDFIKSLGLSDQVEVFRHAIYTFQARIVEKWAKGRIFLAGDAAHQTPPFLGQGMCAGIRDVHNLGWKLHLVLSELADECILKTYGSERSPHVAELIKGATVFGFLIQIRNPVLAAIRNGVLHLAGKFPALVKFVAKQIAKKKKLTNGIFGTNTKKLAGSLFVQEELEDIDTAVRKLSDEFLGNGFAIVTQAPLPLALLYNLGKRLDIRILNVGFEQEIGIDLVDIDGELFTPYLQYNIDFIVVRPDRCIFDAGKASDFPIVIQDLFNQLNL